MLVMAQGLLRMLAWSRRVNTWLVLQLRFMDAYFVGLHI